jgi:hypothetical protein
MFSNSKLCAIVFVASLGLASPALAASPGPYGEGYTGGGSGGYNHHVATDYKLKHHQTKHRSSAYK